MQLDLVRRRAALPVLPIEEPNANHRHSRPWPPRLDHPSRLHALHDLLPNPRELGCIP